LPFPKSTNFPFIKSCLCNTKFSPTFTLFTDTAFCCKARLASPFDAKKTTFGRQGINHTQTIFNRFQPNSRGWHHLPYHTKISCSLNSIQCLPWSSFCCIKLPEVFIALAINCSPCTIRVISLPTFSVKFGLQGQHYVPSHNFQSHLSIKM
jgi:hypothetical protein